MILEEKDDKIIIGTKESERQNEGEGRRGSGVLDRVIVPKSFQFATSSFIYHYLYHLYITASGHLYHLRKLGYVMCIGGDDVANLVLCYGAESLYVMMWCVTSSGGSGDYRP